MAAIMPIHVVGLGGNKDIEIIIIGVHGFMYKFKSDSQG